MAVTDWVQAEDGGDCGRLRELWDGGLKEGERGSVWMERGGGGVLNSSSQSILQGGLDIYHYNTSCCKHGCQKTKSP